MEVRVVPSFFGKKFLVQWKPDVMCLRWRTGPKFKTVDEAKHAAKMLKEAQPR